MDNVKFCPCIPTWLVMNRTSLFTKWLEICKQNIIIFKPCRSMNDLTALCVNIHE